MPTHPAPSRHRTRRRLFGRLTLFAAVCVVAALATGIPEWLVTRNPAAAGRGLYATAQVGELVCVPVRVPLRADMLNLPLPTRGGLGVVLAVHAVAWAFWLGLLVWVGIGLRGVWRAADARIARLPTDRSRRAAMRSFVAAPVLMGVAGSSAAGVKALAVDPYRLTVRRYRVPIAGLPRSLEGLRIVQFSDPHVGPRTPMSFLKRAVEQAADLRPDLVALTGDYIHHDIRQIAPAAELLAPLASLGVPCVGVLGNHDWYGDGPRTGEALSAVGVRMLDNTRVYLTSDRELTDDARGAALCLAGVGDLTTDRVAFGEALMGVPHDVPRVLLSHQPDVAEMAQPHRVDLMLCGHTHGGQVRLPLLGAPIIPSRFGQKYEGGLVAGPWCPVVVSRGVGMSGLPIRFGVPPEIVEITLARA
jgi:predicted MPP superfamily phosphohydrolase